MGAHPYQYIVPFEANVQAALDKLRREVFESGDYHGADPSASSPEEALELASESGTRSILDISRVTDEPDHFCTAPFSDEELTQYLGTAQPTAEMVEGCEAIWEGLERGQARHVVTYRDGSPSGIMFVGYSFD